ncbi:MAG: GNAT family N-acetyltransferase [Pyrinomonadaceae bacterium]
MMEDAKIRRAAAADANVIAALAATTAYETYFETDEPEDLAKYIADFFNPQAVKTELEDKDSTFFLVEVNGKAVGYAKLREGQPDECVKDENIIELHRLYVLEKMIRHGIGRLLMRKCLDEAKSRGFDALWLSVFNLNARAIGFYEKLGFTRVGETGFYYGEKRLSCWVMRIGLQVRGEK